MAQQERPEQMGRQDQMGLKGPLAQQERTELKEKTGQWDLQVSKDR